MRGEGRGGEGGTALKLEKAKIGLLLLEHGQQSGWSLGDWTIDCRKLSNSFVWFVNWAFRIRIGRVSE